MRVRFEELLLVCGVVASLLSGCGTQPAVENKGAADDAPAERSRRPTFNTQIVAAQTYEQRLDLPGASLHGYEVAQVLSKVGGYVAEIGTVNERPIDIGTIVQEGARLVRIDAPELGDDLKEKKALVEQANAEFRQADAAVLQAQSEVDRRLAEVDEAQAMKKEKQALQALHATKLSRIQGLVQSGSVGKDILDEAKFAADSATAAVETVEAAVLTAHKSHAASEASLKKTEADRDAAESHIQVAESVEDRAQTMAGYCNVIAPFTGMITQRFVDRGAFVRSATSNSGAMPLFEITQVDRLRLVAFVPNIKATQVMVGQHVEFHHIGGLDGVVVSGVLARSAGAFNAESRMMRVEVDLTQVPHEQGQAAFVDEQENPVPLRSGMFGTLTVIQTWENLPTVPADAVVIDSDGQAYVMVVDASSTCHRRNVKQVELGDAKHVGISQGLKAGSDTVVVSGVAELEDGQRVDRP
ncbi:MAG: efflux RND transporter periplasmic adaptor subunit [Planctomycetaceae bacterium]